MSRILYNMIMSGNAELAKHFINTTSIDYNYIDSYDISTLLHAAFCLGKVEIAQLLISRGANITAIDRNGDTPIHVACRYGKTEIVKYFLPKFDVDMKNSVGNTMLHIVCTANLDFITTTKMIDLLMQNKIDIDAQNKEGNTALHLACTSGELTIIFRLILSGADINKKNEQGLTALHSVCMLQKEKIDVVKLLLHFNVDVNQTDKKEKTALHHACIQNNINTAKLLIQSKVDVNKKDISGCTALYYVCGNNYVELAVLLIQNGALNTPNEEGMTPSMNIRSSYLAKFMFKKENIDIQDIRGKTALHHALQNKRLEFAKFLLNNGAHNTADSSGSTPFFVAVKNGYIDVVQLMLEKNLVQDINAQDNAGFTALHYTHKQYLDSDFNIVKLLFKYGASDTQDVDGNTTFGCGVKYKIYYVVRTMLEKGWVRNIDAQHIGTQTPLHYACKHNYTDIAKLLIQNGACNALYGIDEPFSCAVQNGMLEIVELMLVKNLVKNTDAVYPLHTACTACNIEMVKLLVKYGFNVNAKNIDGQTPLFVACLKNNETIIRILVENGADVNDNSIKNNEFLQIIRAYQSGLCDANDSVEYGIAMLNKFIRGGEVREDLVESDVMYRYAAMYAAIVMRIKKCSGEDEVYNMIRSYKLEYMVEYINNPFISYDVKNKLLLEGFMWYRLSQDGSYKLQDIFYHIRRDHELDAKLKIIELGEKILDDQCRQEINGHEYSRHVYHMTMNAMEKYKKRDDGSLRHPEEVFNLARKIPGVYSEYMPNLKAYAKSLAEAHPKESWMLKDLCQRYDNETFDLFNYIKQNFADLKDFNCVYNCTEYELLKSCIEAYRAFKAYFCNMTEAHVKWNSDDNELEYNLAEFYRVKECGKKIVDLEKYQNMMNGIKDWQQKYEKIKNDIKSLRQHENAENDAAALQLVKTDKNIWSVKEFMYFLHDIGVVDDKYPVLDSRYLFHVSHFDQKTVNNIMELIGHDFEL